MIVGDPENFAIESHISHAYEGSSLRALGYYVVFVKGRVFGVRAEDASMLGCSFGNVCRCLQNRGRHLLAFDSKFDARSVAGAFCEWWSSESESEGFLEIPSEQFGDCIYKNHIIFAPDGDEAFDDSSYILQFDVDNQVRVIAFQLAQTGFLFDPKSLREVWLSSDTFYGVLQKWRDDFELEWKGMAKTPYE